MAIWRGAGGPGDATTDAANEASVASAKAAEAVVSADAAASSASSAVNSASIALDSKNAAATSEANALTSELAAATSETNAANSESNAATSETNAGISETNSSNSASSALASKNAAAISEANAATSETNAANSESNAATSEANAAASFDSFDDRYLGAKATDPAVDNDSNPLIVGALYFNTTSNDMKVYNGSTWEVTFATLSGALVAANNLSDVVDVSASRTNLGLVIGTDVQAYTAVLAGTTASYTTAEETKLAGIETGATADQTGAQIKTAYEAETNAFTDAQFTKLAGIETGATADQTGAQIKTAYEAETNAFTDAQFTKLAGIETAADVTDATNVTAAGALMDSELTSIASVKALNQGVATTDSPSFAGLTVDTNTLYVDSTNNRVGIGLTNPARNLQISDSGTPTIRLQDTGGTNQYAELFVSGSSVVLQARNDTADGTIQFRGLGGGVATERMRITSGGNVGIGTSSPASILEVSATEPYITISSTASQTGNALGGIRFDTADPSYGAGGYPAYITAQDISANGSAFGLVFGTQNAERMRINHLGNVGIGTSSPATKLHVLSGTNAGISVNDGTVNTILYNTSSANGSLGTTTNHPMAFYANNAERMRITAAGNVGIGTSTLNGTLLVINQSGEDAPSSSGNMNTGSFLGAVSTGGAALNIGHDADGTWYNSAYFNNAGVARIHRWLTGGTERMRIDTSGNLKFNSGYGSVATAYGCRAWVNFNGTGTPAIRGSGNVSSITDNGSGNYTVNFTTSMPDANYSVFTTNIRKEATYSVGYAVFASDTSTTSYRPAVSKVTVFAALGDSSTDTADVYVGIFR